MTSSVPAGRRYLPGTLVLETTWQTAYGWLVVRDALLVGPWRHATHRSEAWHRTPADYEAEHVLLRMVRCVEGEVRLALECRPAPQYGLSSCTWRYVDEGYATVETPVADDNGESCVLRLAGNLNLGIEGPTVIARKTIRENERVFVSLSWLDGCPPTSNDEAYRRMTATSGSWRRWLNSGSFPDHPWREYLQRSALTLKGLSHAPTGAFIAAEWRPPRWCATGSMTSSPRT
jgi:alpha,alpha-trehalase